MGWITHPEKWIEGIRLAYHFQLATTQAPDLRKRIDDDCAGRTKSNEKFFLSLDNEITSGEPLLLPNKMGSIIVARTEGLFICFGIFHTDCHILCCLFLCLLILICYNVTCDM